MPGIGSERLATATAHACLCTCALGLQSRDIALADRVRYHMNVFWENAPDRRTSRTPDWLNDACEARLDKEDRHQGKVTYVALMSPTWVAFTFPSFYWKRPFRRARERKYTGGSPISLLVTTEPDTTTAIESYALFGMKERLGKRAAVRKYRRADIHDAVKPDDFHCTLHLCAGKKIDVGFATKFEVDVLVECLKPNQGRIGNGCGE
jgi:hypothetical protein